MIKLGDIVTATLKTGERLVGTVFSRTFEENPRYGVKCGKKYINDDQIKKVQSYEMD